MADRALTVFDARCAWPHADDLDVLTRGPEHLEVRAPIFEAQPSQASIARRNEEIRVADHGEIMIHKVFWQLPEPIIPACSRLRELLRGGADRLPEAADRLPEAADGGPEAADGIPQTAVRIPETADGLPEARMTNTVDLVAEGPDRLG